MKELEWIDDYFSGRLSPVDRQHFEASLLKNTPFAQTVAFYLLARQVARKETRRNIKPLPVRRLPGWVVGAVAASLVFLLGLSWYFWLRPTPPSATELVEHYLTGNYYHLPTTLDGRKDSLTTGAHYVNEGRWQEAKAVFESILERQPDHPDALKLAGLVSLRLGQYDQAIDRFHRLGQQSDLYANPGIFLEALAYLKRGQPMDKNRAENLLRTVIQDNLEGKDEAEQLVKRIKGN
ncbi:hypothetical protein GCM10028803_27510 [Larkinella knui]|uniref:Tetratricopeptide repeat protein n=1 Tax=Larkinella knui TaxID=2025310 RepID=A0A3P1CWX5_9BACT|nr:tetratricopeptide repeat protein [Larkinella knui]RRB17793.1 tetratricopeptide repeat protein [Larkinella knui]